MSFLPSNLMEEVSPNSEALSADTYSLSSAWKGWEDIGYGLGIIALI